MSLKPGQEKCINTLDRSLVVAAGAGSGKTFTLTKRIVHAIESGAVDGIERVCAITFTNKAAGELKSRIKAELRACGLAGQALKVDEAWVSTIHGMCARILRAHAVELNLDPSFQMADQVTSDLLRDRAIESVLASARAGGGMGGDAGNSPVDAGAVDALFAEYPAVSRGLRGNSVESMLSALMGAAGSCVDGFDAFAMPESRVNPAQLVEAALGAFEDLAVSARAQKPNAAREAWAADMEENCTSIHTGMQQGHAADPLWALEALSGLSVPRKAGSADFKEKVAETASMRDMCIMELRLAAAAPHLATLVALARRAQDAFAAEKRAAGVLDNDDLLVFASRAIAEHPKIAALYADKFQLVMVDEFQDTDQMQVDMIKRLAGPGACRLCTVGDAQQSIYRFRGADVSVYRRHLEQVRAASPGDVIQLPDNFRSHPDVLSLVDRVFERPEMFGGEFMSLTPARDEARVKRPFAQDVPRIQVQQVSSSYKNGASTEKMRELAACRIAATFADLHERGHSAGEMAVLLGGMTYADVYARALREKGLACVITGGSVFSKMPEAALVLDLARVVANPYHTQALHNVLASPLFELCAGDFLELTTRVGEEDGLPRRRNLADGLRACAKALRKSEVPEGWSDQLLLALRVMGELIDAARRSRTSRIVMRAVTDSGWLSRLQASGAEGLASAGNVYKAVRMLEEIEEAGAAGPGRTARLFELALGEAKEPPGALSATGGDFVRIMTVHASKGLEFPIVAVAEFKDSLVSSGKLLSSKVDGKVHLSLDLQNSLDAMGKQAKMSPRPVYEALMEGAVCEDDFDRVLRHAEGALELRAALSCRDALGDAEEQKRLLYVALTRAKEALVISLIGRSTKDNPGAIPKSVLGQVVPALAGEAGSFAEGVSVFDFGGGAPALVERVELEADVADEPGAAGVEAPESIAAVLEAVPGPDGAGRPSSGEPSGREAFFVPAAEVRPPVHRTPYAPAHEGVFSYSSIADASHGADALEQLAAAGFVSADEPHQQELFSLWLQPSEEGEADFDFAFSWQQANRNAAVADEDDGSWAYAGSSCADSDKATDLGTAFHRLAQHAVAIRGEDCAELEKPGQERVTALAKACNLDAEQQGRLAEALDRWFGSELAEEMAGFADLRAEVPFFVALPVGSAGGHADGVEFLEGEIDLLALADGGKRVRVVDYKTGGRDSETEGELRLKHVLQAACYAYAVMRQGASDVRADFVRVEHSRLGAPDQPQCVRYRFTAADLPMIASAIASLRA